jgi:hypothetical protein
MKQTVLRYGLYAGFLIIGLMAFNFFILARTAAYATQEVAGYLAIFLSMIFVFLGIRHYRDHLNGGALSFTEGLKLGLLIALIPSACFALFDLLYTEVLNPGWKSDYYNYYVTQLKESTPAENLEKELATLADQRDKYDNPYILFGMMFATVFVIGTIVAIISSLALRKPKPVTA